MPGIDKQTLLDYVKGVNSNGKAFSRTNPDYKRIVAAEDFHILQRAYSLIETFYEEKLGENRNNALLANYGKYGVTRAELEPIIDDGHIEL